MSILDGVKSQLESLDPKYGMQSKGEDIWIRCPFHSGKSSELENTPSCKINLSNPDFGWGSFYCFACSKHGNWNDLAAAIGLRGFAKKDQDDITKISIHNKRSDLGLSDTNKYNLIVNDESIPWDANKDWRGISGKLVNKLGGRLIYSKVVDDTQLFLPVFVNKKMIGGINCLIERPSKKVKAYFNTPGSWSNEALFPYDIVKRMKSNILTIVEGPRDALNLIQHGLPALATLGASKWNQKLVDLILFGLEPKLILLGFDPDEAGRLATKRVKTAFKNLLPIKKIKMDKDIDPAKLTKKQINKIIYNANKYLEDY